MPGPREGMSVSGIGSREEVAMITLKEGKPFKIYFLI